MLRLGIGVGAGARPRVCLPSPSSGHPLTHFGVCISPPGSPADVCAHEGKVQLRCTPWTSSMLVEMSPCPLCPQLLPSSPLGTAPHAASPETIPARLSTPQSTFFLMRNPLKELSLGAGWRAGRSLEAAAPDGALGTPLGGCSATCEGHGRRHANFQISPATLNSLCLSYLTLIPRYELRVKDQNSPCVFTGAPGVLRGAAMGG